MAKHEVEFGHGADGTPTSSKVRRRQAAIEMDREYSGESENCHRHDNDSALSNLQHAERDIEGWMASDGHRRNMLNPDHEYIGVGVAANSDGALYFTQIYLKLPRERRPQ